LTGIAIGPDGSVYVSNALNSIIIRIDKDTQNITTFAGGGPRPLFSGDGGPAILSNLDNPNGIVFDSKSNMFICDSSNFRIRKVTPFVTTTIPGKTTYNPPWFAPVEYIEICNCKINTPIAAETPIAIYDGAGS
jgi:streptogramin lyase